MRTLVLVVGVVLLAVGGAGCGRKRVRVANTPEGQACRRECMTLFNECYQGKRRNKKLCMQRENECLMTCPAAATGSEEEQSVTPPPES